MRQVFTFLRESLVDLRQTGAVLPSSRSLARAMTFPLREVGRPIRVLEAGAGTGVITREILTHLNPPDRLVIYEPNRKLYQVLEGSLERILSHKSSKLEVQLVGKPIETIDPLERFDFIFSGLPLNSFEPEKVEEILRLFSHLCREEGVLSYFEYVGFRSLRRHLGTRAVRRKVRTLDRVLQEFLESHRVERRVVVWNVPPAWVRHLRRNLVKNPPRGLGASPARTQTPSALQSHSLPWFSRARKSNSGAK